eukprot:31375-Eustigmatos_ZCMA.PRE.1
MKLTVHVCAFHQEHNAVMRYNWALCRRILSALAGRCAVTAAKGQAVQLRNRLVASRGLIACWRRTWVAEKERVTRRMLKAAQMERACVVRRQTQSKMSELVAWCYIPAGMPADQAKSDTHMGRHDRAMERGEGA